MPFECPAFIYYINLPSNNYMDMKVFDNRNEMLKHYCQQITNPRILEIGVFKGELLGYIVNNCNVGSFDAVDLFTGVTCSGDADGNNVVYYDVGKSYIELTQMYQNNPCVSIHKSDSGAYLNGQPDNTFDIIYIDGDHSYNGVKRDLINAYKKIKDNGYIMGHDYEMNMAKAHTTYDFGVKKAVDEFCKEYNQTIIAKANDGCVSFCIQITKHTIVNEHDSSMNLIYMCVFHQESYINLLQLLLTSIQEKANVNRKTTDILIITSPTFYPIIQAQVSSIDLPLKYHILDIHTLMEASCCKLTIFEYKDIDKYNKILYLDTDVLLNADVNVLLDHDISSDKIYALEEGVIGHEFWGAQFFNFTSYNRDTPAYSAGVLYFRNSSAMKGLFSDINTHINSYMQHHGPPVCLDQPFVVYNSVMQNKCDNQFMKQYMENNPAYVSPTKIIYHFPGGPGDYSSKIHKMTAFWRKCKYLQ